MSHYQEWLAHGTGEINEPEPPEPRCHGVHDGDTQVRVNLQTREISCLACDEVLNIEELYEELAPDMGKPYDLILDLGELGGCRP